MTKKDYKIIAGALKQHINGNYVEIVDALIKALANENPRFDGSKFYDACGIKEDGEKHYVKK